MTDLIEERTTALRSWLTANGGKFHPDADFKADTSGFSIIASQQIPPNATIVECPFSLVITPEVAQAALVEVLGSSLLNADWSERQWICVYICLHWIFQGSQLPNALAHLAYINTLPRPEQLSTPLHFNTAELDAFKGTNLYGATVDRERNWKEEWEECLSIVFICLAKDRSNEFTWTRYLAASTYISSRAFPSTLLSPNPTLVNTPSSYPILIPGVDALNHARGHPVSWVVSKSNPASKSLAISLVIHSPTPAGSELLNNYGPKPNSELILGYGFSIPQNPDDTIVLSVGGVQDTAKQTWEVGRGANGVDGLWAQVLDAVSQTPTSEKDSEESPAKRFEDQLDAAGMLGQMCQAYLDRLPDPANTRNIRPNVQGMLEHYVEGQRDILEAIVRFAQEKEEEAVEQAAALGIDLDYE